MELEARPPSAKRATAVVCGLEAAEDAARRFIAMEKEWEAEQRAKWEAKRAADETNKEWRVCDIEDKEREIAWGTQLRAV